ncbi:MAG: H-NS histone family protein [Rhodobacteraceae bacterium]|nr:H-NS histone family protein [Paracoccaceae bacterium]
MTVDLTSMSTKELSALVEDAQSRIAEQRETEIKELREKVLEMIFDAGFDVKDIFPSTAYKGGTKASKEPVEPVYRNPNNHDETAGARGAKPKWLKAMIDSGVDIETLKIENQ